MEQVALTVTAIIILFVPFGVKISDNNKTMLNLMINVSNSNVNRD
jgi:hypothetical protein